MRGDPLIIGALGGSGTRVFVRLARAAGVFMGSRLNEAEDSEPLMAFYDAWLRRYLESGGALSGSERVAMETRFRACVAEHRGEGGSAALPWGVKVPRSILMLPFWHERFPDFRFIHVVRNGLDMAYSADKNQLAMVGDLVLSTEEQLCREPLRAIAYWQRVNLAAAEFGERQLGGRYLRVRFEDLCAEPTRLGAELGDFLGVTNRAALLGQGVAHIVVPQTIGRWQTHSVEEINELLELGRAGLERFGYWRAPAWEESRVPRRRWWRGWRLLRKRLHGVARGT